MDYLFYKILNLELKMKYSGPPNQSMRASPDGGNIPTQYYGLLPQYPVESMPQAPNPYFLSYQTHVQYTPMFKENDEDNITANTDKKQVFKKKIKASSFTVDDSEEEDKEFQI